MAAATGGDWLYFRLPLNDDGRPTHSLGVEALHGRLSRAGAGNRNRLRRAQVM